MDFRKVILIGIDGGMPYFVRKFVKEGVMKNFKKLLKDGTLLDAFPYPPCDTPTNWTTIATGTTPAIHGATGFYTHCKGEDLDFGMRKENRSRSFLSTFCHAEYIWDTIDKYGMKSLVVNYLAGWPPSFKNGIMMNGSGIPPHQLLPSQKIEIMSFPAKIEISEKFLAELIKFKVSIKSNDIFEVYFNKKNLTTIKIKKWSNWIKLTTKINSTEAGRWTFGWIPWKPKLSKGSIDVYFKFKIEKKVNKKYELVTTPFYTLYDYIYPQEIGRKVLENVELPLGVETLKERTFFTEIDNAHAEAIRISNIIEYIHKNVGFNLCMLHFHVMDGINHWYLAPLLKKTHWYLPKKYKEAYEMHRLGYKIVDTLIGRIVDSVFDDQTTIVVVSDHAAIPSWKVVNLRLPLIEAGLLTYKYDSSIGRYVVDWSKTKAFIYSEPPYVWVNLKGREPHGIVEKNEYESVRERIIDALLNFRDPSTGERIIQLVLRREESGFLGQNSEYCGDVIFFYSPGYQVWDGSFEDLNYYEILPEKFSLPPVSPSKSVNGMHGYYLPTAKIGNFSVNSILMFSGAGIKRNAKVKRFIWLSDVAPTISHLLSTPPPKDCVGNIIHEILK